jgi:hypothetical protein
MFWFGGNDVTSEERAYIAGIIDGEGSIMLIRFHKNQHPAPCINISSATIELLEWVLEITKMRSIQSKKNYKPHCHQNSYTYTVRYNDAIELLSKVEPYLIIQQKKQRGKMILTEYKSLTPRNGRYSPALLKAKEYFYQRFISL